MVIVAATADRSPLERVRGAHRRDRDRRVLPRPRQERAARDRLADALRDGAARDRPGARRAAGDQGLSAERVRDAAAPARARRAARRRRLDHRRSTPCSSRATTSPTRSPTPRARCSTATSCCRATSPARGHFPAIDVLASASRVARRVATPGDADRSRTARARCCRAGARPQELQALGAYTPGANASLDDALAIGERIDTWARQAPARTLAPRRHGARPRRRARRRRYK